MTEKERKSCIGTVETLRRLAFNVHGVMDVIDNQNCDKIISALSTEGEYIKKSELLQHVTTEELSDFKDCDVIHAEEIDELTTYSYPDSAENKGEWIPISSIDEIPKEGAYWVTFEYENGHRYTSSIGWDSDREYWCDSEGWSMDKDDQKLITAYMPYFEPEPYKAEKGGEEE